MSFKNRVLLFNRPVIIRYFLRSVLSYLLVVILGASFIFPVIGYVRNLLLQERLSTEQEGSEASMNMLSRQLETLSHTFLYLSNQKGFDRLRLVQGQISARDYVYLAHARDFLNSIRCANTLVEDIIVSFFCNDVIITANYAFDSFSDFADFYPAAEIQPMIANFSKGIITDRRHQVFPEIAIRLSHHTATQNVIPFCVPLCSQNVYPLRVLGCVVILLRSDQVKNMLFSSAVQTKGLYEISRPEGGCILGNIPGTEEEPLLSSYAFLAVPGDFLSARIGIPSDTVYQQVQPVLSILARYMIAGILLGLLTSFISAVRSTRPVQKVLEEIGGTDALSRNQTAHQFILQSIDRMLENIHHLNAVSAAAARTQLNSRLNRLLSGCGTEQDAAPPVPPRGVLCYVMYRSAKEKQADAAALSPLLADYVESRLPAGYLLHILTGESFLIFAPCEEETHRPRTAVCLRQIFEEAAGLFSAALTGVMGTPYASLDEISISFETIKLLHYTVREGNEDAVTLVESEPQNSRMLTIAHQTELFHLLAAGKAEGARRRIEAFFLEYQDFGLEQVYYTLRMVLMMAMAQQNAVFPLRPYRAHVTPDENIAELLSAADRLCACVNQGKRSHNDQLKEKILACIDEKFTDSNLYNTTLADMCGISEKYLCSFVKEQIGRTVTDLIQSRRVGYAHELLVHSEKAVNDIYHMAGFSSYNTFYKTMKRVYGMSPLELRAQQEQSGLTEC